MTKKVDFQIGVYEIFDNMIPNVLDEQGDVDIDKLGEPLIYSFVTKDILKEDEEDTEQEDTSDGSNTETDEENTDEEDDISEDDGKFLGFSPLVEQNKEMAIKEKNKYQDKDDNPWIQNYFKNNNYEIIDNEGGGDCLFASIRDGLNNSR